ncbi:MAG: hypothetical protein AB7O59_18610 [Pirellulales bacterium]
MNAMLSFYVSVHARPTNATAGATIALSGRPVQALALQPAELATTAFPCSFETAQERLSKLERMFCEADGSFVWTSPQSALTWQVDGNLYDRDGRLLFVDLKGSCPSDQFDRLLAALGWPEAKLVFQLTREAVFLDEAEFRRHAAAAHREKPF